MPSPASKPSIVLVPGALHTPQAYHPLTSALRSHGYKVLPISLPSIGHDASSFPPSGIADVATVRAVIAQCVGRGEEVMVLMHSLGGVIGSEACKGLVQTHSEQGGVLKLFFMSGCLVPEGEHVGRYLEGKFGGFESYLVFGAANGTVSADLEQAAEFWWNGVSAQQVEEQKEVLGGVKMSAGMTDFVVEYPAWKYISSTYLLTEEDKSLLPDVQEGFTQLEGAEGVKVLRCEGGHCAWLSRTEEVVRAIRKAAGERVDA